MSVKMRLLGFGLALCLLVKPVLAGSFAEGESALKRGDYETAMQIWRPLAESGDPRAQNGLGWMYSGKMGVPQNFVEAAKWYLLAAEQGYAPSQLWLGKLYLKGQGVPADAAQALNWFQQAAEQHHAPSQAQLAAIYYVGDGVPQDYVRAYMWLAIAAQGDPHVAAGLGKLATILTSDQIDEAKLLAQEWFREHPKP
jgi:uncharacterized protein